MKKSFAIVALLFVLGCVPPTKAVVTPKVPDNSATPIIDVNSELVRRVTAAFLNSGKPNAKLAARDYAGLYTAFADCVEFDQNIKNTAQALDICVTARERIGLTHGEYPEFTKIVTEQTASFVDTVEFDDVNKGKETRSRLAAVYRQMGAAAAVAAK